MAIHPKAVISLKSRNVNLLVVLEGKSVGFISLDHEYLYIFHDNLSNSLDISVQTSEPKRWNNRQTDITIPSQSHAVSLNKTVFFPVSENVPVELREPLYKDQYEQEHLKPSVSKLLLSPEIYCRAQALLAQAHGVSLPASQGSPADNSALLQFLIKKGFTPKVQDADVTEEDLSYVPIRTVGVVVCV